MGEDDSSRLTRRDALKLTGGMATGLSGIGAASTTLGASESSGSGSTKYVVYASLKYTGVDATNHKVFAHIKEATKHLNARLDVDTELKVVGMGIQDGPTGNIDNEWFQPSFPEQSWVIEQIASDMATNQGAWETRLDKITPDGDSPTLSDTYWVFVHNVGDVTTTTRSTQHTFSSVGGTGVSGAGDLRGSTTALNIPLGASFSGWSDKNVVYHKEKADIPIDIVFLGPKGIMDPRGTIGDACRKVKGRQISNWQAKQLAWQSVGHVLGADHTDGGYRTKGSGDSKYVSEISVMASGHLYDKFARQDMLTKDGSPFVERGDAVLVDTDGDGSPDRAKTNSKGELYYKEASNINERPRPLADFEGWGGGQNPAIEAELPLNERELANFYEKIKLKVDESDRNRFQRIGTCLSWARGEQARRFHVTKFTDKARNQIKDTLKGDPNPSVSIRVPDAGLSKKSKTGLLRVGDTITLEAVLSNVTTDIRTYEWALGETVPDGVEAGDVFQSRKKQKVTFAPTEPGTYGIRVSAFADGTFETGDQNTATNFIADSTDLSVFEAFEPKFALSKETVPVGESLTFDATESSGKIATYEWIIDGPEESTTDYSESGAEQLAGNLPTGETLTREFNTPGTYAVTLVITEKETGITAGTDPKTVEVTPRQTQDGSDTTDGGSGQQEGFSVGIETSKDGPISKNETIEFSADVEWTSSAVTELQWSGAVSGGLSTVTTRFEEAGPKTVSLFAKNRNGETDTAETTVQVTEEQTPEVKIVGGRDEVKEGETVQFRADASVSRGSISEYRWNDVVDESDGSTATVVFGTPGDITVEVTAIADSGAQKTASRTVNVERDPTPDNRPSVTLTGPTRVVAGKSVTYTADASDDGSVVSYAWGEAAAGETGESVELAFQDTGLTAVSVTVRDDSGQPNTDRLPVRVLPKPPGGNSAPEVTVEGPDVVGVGNTAEFVAEVKDPDRDPVPTFDWNVGGVSKRIATKFQEAGEQTVEVRVADTHGASTTASKQVTVKPQGSLEPLEAKISVPAEIPAGEAVTFDASESKGQIASYRWSLEELAPFGSNPEVPLSKSTGKRISHVFEKETTYVVRLTVTSAGGRTDMATQTFSVSQMGQGTDEKETSTGGTKRWTFEYAVEYQYPIENQGPPSVVDSTVYVGTQKSVNLEGGEDGVGAAEATVYAINAGDGTLEWTAGTPYGLSARPTVAGNTLYVGTGVGGVAAFKVASGGKHIEVTSDEALWYKDIGDSVGGLAVVGDTVYAVGEQLYALSAGDGKVKRVIDVTGWHLSVVNGTLYISSGDVVALDASSGKEQWRFKKGNISVHTVATGDDATVYGLYKDDSVYALDSASGALQWSFKFENVSLTKRSPPVVENRNLYIAGSDPKGRLHALSTVDGSKQWTADIKGGVAAKNDTAYVAGLDGKIHALNAADGTQQWTYNLSASGFDHLPEITLSNSTLYVVADKTVYAVGIGTTESGE